MIGEVKKSRKAKKSSGSIGNLLFLLASLCAFVMTVYVGYRIYISGQHLISLGFIALLAGVLFECRRIANKWVEILPLLIGSYFFSFLAFLPGKRESIYIFENHIKSWPYAFLIIFIIAYISFFKEKVTFKLFEGFTLLQTLAVVYWVADCGLLSTNSQLLIAVIIFGLICSLYAAFHAFTYTELTHNHRLLLSVWSSTIMLVFSIENIIITFSLDDLANIASLPMAIYVGLQYFLLGVCGIYMAQNFFMLLQFLPGRGRFFNDVYFRDLKELKEDHLERYSNKQVRRRHSAIVVIILVIFFFLNHQYEFIPRHMAIWCAFIALPLLFRWTASPKHISVS